MVKMRENILKTKTFSFSIRIVNCYKYLIQEKKEFVLSEQLLRSGTSVGAMVREAEHSESKPDFIHKMAIAQKEINESIYLYENRAILKQISNNCIQNNNTLSWESKAQQMMALYNKSVLK